jgi:hypothetical protein
VLVTGEANAIAPMKAPLSSMTPTIVSKDGPTAKAEAALSDMLAALTEKLSAPDVPLTGSEILPLVTATTGLADWQGT